MTRVDWVTLGVFVVAFGMFVWAVAGTKPCADRERKWWRRDPS